MKRVRRFAISAAVGAVVAGFGIARGGTYVDTGSSAFTPGANDAFQGTIGSASTSADGLNYYTDQHYAGQTFITGSNVGGYSLTAFSMAFGDPNATNPTFAGAVGTVAGTTFASIDSESYTTAGSITANDWVTFTPSSPILLAPNTLYGFDLHNTTSTWDGPDQVGGNPYADGQIFLADNATNTAMTYGATGSNDASFDVALTPVPEPAMVSIMGFGGLTLFLWRRRKPIQ